MLRAPAGAPRSASLQLALLSLVLMLAGCSPNPATGSVQVQVNLEPGLISTCVKVTARDGLAARETRSIALAGKTSPLRIGMTADGLSQPVTVQALGYSDVDCTILSPGEVSEVKEVVFGSPPSTVTLTLRPAGAGADGGPDGGEVDGGTDAGTDAGIDLDMDGSPLPDDCNDNDPSIKPGTAEICTDGVDQDCDSAIDCEETSCDTQPCANGGTCGSGICNTPNEVCNDRVDNNANNLVDCADPGCVMGTACSDGDPCTTGERCVAGGACQKTGDIMCTTPPAPQCYATVGTCLPDAGASCRYTPMAGSCDDGFACTNNDTCTNGTCAGAARVCNTPGNACLQAIGTCQEPGGGCTYAPRASGTCDDGQNCTTNDSCDGAGGCAGTPVVCTPPSQCHGASTGCTTGGGCLFGTRSGQACDAGTGAGTCDLSFNCNRSQTTLFPFTPSNFTEGQLSTDAGVAFNVPSSRTLDTDTPDLTVGTIPPFTIITQGGESTLLIRVTSMFINSGQTLTITGSRPVIFAVTGNAQIDGTLRAQNGSGSTACGNGGNGNNDGSGNGLGGGGGGGFGSAGGLGGASGGAGNGAVGAVNGSAPLIPLRGGCNGGNGSSNGGQGGGAVQITASGTITIANTLAAPGRAGQGASATAGNSGGGGGSGGAILLEGATVAVNSSARITANGASGGEGSSGGAGADGLDGNQTSSNTTANGGNDQANGGNGGVGAGGTTNAGVGGDGAGNGDGAGGAGGGVGRIRFNASTSCNIATSGRVISPPATSNGAASCP